jgi:hypothetical protein
MRLERHLMDAVTGAAGSHNTFPYKIVTKLFNPDFTGI